MTVIVDLPTSPASKETLEGLLVRENAVPTVYVIDAEWDNPLPAPVTVTVNGPDPVR